MEQKDNSCYTALDSKTQPIGGKLQKADVLFNMMKFLITMQK
jgi:hypothetical protein